VISDGEDQNSHLNLRDAQQLIRESEVLVYGIAIDPSGRSYFSGGGSYSNPNPNPQPSAPVRQPSAPPRPSPFPGKKPPAPSAPSAPAPSAPPPVYSSPRNYGSGSAGVNALRSLTDDSGGRTEVIQGPRDLDPATAGIADELSRQYFLGYISTQPKDGKWHEIEVQVRKGQFHVRARKGYIAG
jgi:VWFA-related protein